jgi:hypothetical protein
VAQKESARIKWKKKKKMMKGEKRRKGIQRDGE